VARGLLVGGVALLVAGGGVLGYGLTRKTSAGTPPAALAAITSGASALDGDVKALRAKVEVRAKTLGTVEIVKAAVSADAGTAKDLVGKEIAFKPEPDEVIELGNVPKGGAPVSLLVLPDGGVRAKQSGKVGAFAQLEGDLVMVTQTVPVEPADPTALGLEAGFVTVSRMLAVKPSLDALAAAGVSGRLELDGAAIPFGPNAAAAKDARPIPALDGAQLVVATAAAKGGVPIGLVGGGAGAAALGLVLALFALLGAKERSGLTRGMPAVDPRGVTELTGVSGIDPGGSIAVQAGAMIGRWEVERRLGSGGMADVYLAHAKGDAGFHKQVALKVMHPHLARMQRAVDHFLDEARLAARVTHPNVVQIQDLGKIGNDYVIVMEYVDGVDLERLLAAARAAERPVPIAVGLGILCRICDGLHAAHTATAPDGQPLGIIHRDVKSANVLVARQGGVKVVDFGIAKAATQAHFTVVGETKGTPSMMAPEQRVGGEVDVRADVYSIAAVGYEVVTGHAVNLDLAALGHLGIENWPHLPPPSSLRPDLPPELDGILLTAMSYDRERRPASCADFEALIDGVMKRHNLSASDKDIGRWAAEEMRAQTGPGVPE
jgi:tRNA A-37 threonylcarbamoyl transferase component Bud32